MPGAAGATSGARGAGLALPQPQDAAAEGDSRTGGPFPRQGCPCGICDTATARSGHRNIPTARAGAEVTPHQLPGGSPGRGTRSGRHSPVTASSSGSAAQGAEEASLSPCHCRSRSSPMNDPAVTHPVGTGSAWLPDALSHIPCRFSPAGVSTREIRPRPPPDPSNRRMPRAHWRNEPRPQPRCLPAPLTARGAIPAGSSGWRSMSAVIGMCERK